MTRSACENIPFLNLKNKSLSFHTNHDLRSRDFSPSEVGGCSSGSKYNHSKSFTIFSCLPSYHLPSSLPEATSPKRTKQNNTTIDYAVFHIQTKEMEGLQSPQSPTICQGSTFPTWPKRTSSHPFFSNHPAKPSQSILVERGIPWNGEKFMKPSKCRWLWSVFVQNNFILI